jgi:hypothetical protein
VKLSPLKKWAGKQREGVGANARAAGSEEHCREVATVTSKPADQGGGRRGEHSSSHISNNNEVHS